MGESSGRRYFWGFALKYRLSQRNYKKFHMDNYNLINGLKDLNVASNKKISIIVFNTL